MSALTFTPHWRALSAFAVAMALLAGGHATAAEHLKLTDASFMQIDEMVASSEGRPNERMRWRGLKSYQTGHYGAAVTAFEVAAYNADKYSQHYLSLIHWHGVGVPVDHVQAYIWADLAAERGSQRPLAVREKMWSQLTAAEQAQVQARGEAFYARYGDAVAKPRVEVKMRSFARQMTGSRVGYTGRGLELWSAPLTGSFGGAARNLAKALAATPESLYGKDGGFARLATYWQQENRLLDGKVDVGPLETIRKPPADGNGNGMNG